MYNHWAKIKTFLLERFLKCLLMSNLSENIAFSIEDKTKVVRSTYVMYCWFLWQAKRELDHQMLIMVVLENSLHFKAERGWGSVGLPFPQVCVCGMLLGCRPCDYSLWKNKDPQSGLFSTFHSPDISQPEERPPPQPPPPPPAGLCAGRGPPTTPSWPSKVWLAAPDRQK